MQKRWTVIFYQTASGQEPARLFITNLNKDMKSKALKEISLLEEKGNKIGPPYSKFIGDGIFELRICFASNISRIFYFFYINKQIILTNGFMKKEQKTPKKEIEMALKYKRDYLERHKNERNKI